MKKIITSIIFFVVISSFSYGQPPTSAKSALAIEKKENHLIDINFTSADEGVYNVSVIDPMGQKITQPIVNKKYSFSSSSEFQLNTKNWRKGIYTVVVSCNGDLNLSKTIRIE